MRPSDIDDAEGWETGDRAPVIVVVGGATTVAPLTTGGWGSTTAVSTSLPHIGVGRVRPSFAEMGGRRKDNRCERSREGILVQRHHRRRPTLGFLISNRENQAS
jgi:hypothetical protein